MGPRLVAQKADLLAKESVQCLASLTVQKRALQKVYLLDTLMADQKVVQWVKESFQCWVRMWAHSRVVVMVYMMDVL